jgi:hypothetical protein
MEREELSCLEPVEELVAIEARPVAGSAPYGGATAVPAPSPAPVALPPVVGVPEVYLPPSVLAALERLGLEASVRERLLKLLRGREALLDFLPLAELKSVELDGDELVLRFDFGKKGERRIEIPERAYFALERGRARRFESDSRTLIVDKSVRMRLGPVGIESIHDGDVKVVKGFLKISLDLHTECIPGKPVRDEDGRILVQTDEQGVPLVVDGQYVPVTADEWLIVEAHGRRIELPLSRLQ